MLPCKQYIVIGNSRSDNRSRPLFGNKGMLYYNVNTCIFAKRYQVGARAGAVITRAAAMMRMMALITSFMMKVYWSLKTRVVMKGR
jgi:hypothetical protein